MIPFILFFRIVCKLWMLLGFQLTTEQEVKKNKTLYTSLQLGIFLFFFQRKVRLTKEVFTC